MPDDTQKEWNLIMQLQEKIDKANDKIDEISLKLEKTQTLIRDYNGLRSRIDICESRLDKSDASRDELNKGNKNIWEKASYITGLIGASAALLTVLMK